MMRIGRNFVIFIVRARKQNYIPFYKKYLRRIRINP